MLPDVIDAGLLRRLLVQGLPKCKVQMSRTNCSEVRRAYKPAIGVNGAIDDIVPMDADEKKKPGSQHVSLEASAIIRARWLMGQNLVQCGGVVLCGVVGCCICPCCIRLVEPHHQN